MGNSYASKPTEVFILIESDTFLFTNAVKADGTPLPLTVEKKENDVALTLFDINESTFSDIIENFLHDRQNQH